MVIYKDDVIVVENCAAILIRTSIFYRFYLQLNLVSLIDINAFLLFK